jgi:hypothetical protein
MKQVVMCGRLACTCLEAGAIDTKVLVVTFGKPHHQWDGGLLLGRDGIGQTMQVEMMFAQGFTMIGDVE